MRVQATETPERKDAFRLEPIAYSESPGRRHRSGAQTSRTTTPRMTRPDGSQGVNV